MPPVGPTKGSSGQVFLVARLFAHHHYFGADRAFTEDGLGAYKMERAARTALRLDGQLCQLTRIIARLCHAHCLSNERCIWGKRDSRHCRSRVAGQGNL
jgi:hypothetical protein